MSDSQRAAPETPDFARLWSDWVTETERQWNAAFNEVMATDQFSQSMGGMMDVWLAMQKTVGEQMGRYLNTINMPSRSDILAVNDRLLEIENRLAAIESAMTARSRADNSADPDGAPSRPARTRKAPQSAPDSAQ